MHPNTYEQRYVGNRLVIGKANAPITTLDKLNPLIKENKPIVVIPFKRRNRYGK